MTVAQEPDTKARKRYQQHYLPLGKLLKEARIAKHGEKPLSLFAKETDADYKDLCNAEKGFISEGNIPVMARIYEVSADTIKKIKAECASKVQLGRKIRVGQRKAKKSKENGGDGVATRKRIAIPKKPDTGIIETLKSVGAISENEISALEAIQAAMGKPLTADIVKTVLNLIRN